MQHDVQAALVTESPFRILRLQPLSPSTPQEPKPESFLNHMNPKPSRPKPQHLEPRLHEAPFVKAQANPEQHP